jgi:UDP-glucose 4-epimerase
MKRILITGIHSFIGNSIKDWLLKYPSDFTINMVDMKEESWKKTDFSKFDVIFHVAGIAHVSYHSKDANLYYKVNRDLAVETAEIAKNAGVKQFIFMSSIIVYGDICSPVIDIRTVPNPTNPYGCSKLEAESDINRLADEFFKVVILRPPMIYGKGSKGNYSRLSKFTKFLPLFPDYENQRSMLYIDNLCEFVRLVIQNEERGIFFPQNPDYVKTSDMVKLIAEAHNRKILLVKGFNPLIKILIRKNATIAKLFGNMVYEKGISDYKEKYQLYDLKQSIYITETQ